jgi:copper chaperone CopZ
MTYTYKITGMTSESCETEVKNALLRLFKVTRAEISKERQSVSISMDNHIPVTTLQNALEKKYIITAIDQSEIPIPVKNRYPTHKWLLFVLGAVIIITILAAIIF